MSDKNRILVIESSAIVSNDSKGLFAPKVISALSDIVSSSNFGLLLLCRELNSSLKQAIEILKTQGVSFVEVLELDSPENPLLEKYLKQTLDTENSFLISDKAESLEIAISNKLGTIFFSKEANAQAELCSNDWSEISNFIKTQARRARVVRNTKETKILVDISLDGVGKNEIDTGIGFFDHMLDLFSKHSFIDLKLKVDGDLSVDEHHTMEDTALALGQAISDALGNKVGIARYGFLLPMDEALAQVAIDFSGRSWLVWDAKFEREKVGELPTEMFFHFFKSFCDAAKCNLNIKVDGDNEHHMIEGIFKAFAKALRMAIESDSRQTGIPSTKGVL